MAAKTTSTREKIEQFLGQKRLAIVGVSRDRADISRQLMTEFRNRGYDAVPVTPTVTEMDGLTCYARVQDIVHEMVDQATPKELVTDISVIDVGPEVSDENVRAFVTAL